jgi:hypothetical protein
VFKQNQRIAEKENSFRELENDILQLAKEKQTRNRKK